MGWGVEVGGRRKIYLLLQNGQVSIIVVVVVVIIVVVKILFFENCSVLRRSTHLRSLSPKNTTQQEDKINRHFCAT